MPYALPPGAGPDTTGVQLQVDSPRLFTLLTPFAYAPPRPLPPKLDALLPIHPEPAPDEEQSWVPVPAGSTDLGSVPGVLWGLVASYGRHTLAVLVHDHLTELARQAPRAERFARQGAADEIFYAALGDPDAGQYRAGWFRSLLLWGGVSLGRYFSHNRFGLGVIAGATVGGWLAGLWFAQNVGGQPFPVAGWILLLMGLALLVLAGLFATRLGRARPHGIAPSPAHSAVAPTRLQAATGFMPHSDGVVGRPGDRWVVRAMVVGAVLLLLWSAWTVMPLPPLLLWGVPGFIAVLGALAFVAGSVFLGLSPARRDALLPLLLVVAGIPVGLVALVTLVVLYLLWIPDAFGPVAEGPINTVGPTFRLD